MFIVIDGIDGVGKSTQLELLKKHLEQLGKKVKIISYPNYKSEASFCVRRYLNGEYGKNVSAKQASLLYAVDRFNDTFDLKKNVNTYDYILSDRYVSASMIHQGGKISDAQERQEFLEWLYDLEYNICDIPKPDITIFLNLTVKASQGLIDSRDDKSYITSSLKKDIHEEDTQHGYNAQSVISEVMQMPGKFELIECEAAGNILGKEEILGKILEKILKK